MKTTHAPWQGGGLTLSGQAPQCLSDDVILLEQGPKWPASELFRFSMTS